MKILNPTAPFLSLIFCLTFLSTSQAQLISVKSVPVATGDQFLLFPSHNMSMGGVSIALEDTWLDPFTNPSRSIQEEGTRVFSTPVFYTISMNDNFDRSQSTGRASTLPVGALWKKGRKFNGVMLAWQQLTIEPPENQIFFGDIVLEDFIPTPPRQHARALDNLYAFATSGIENEDGSTSMGVSATFAKLNGVEGVRLMYALADEIDQEGLMAQFRLGLKTELSPAGVLDVVLLHHRFSMKHTINNSRQEKDETNGVGISLNYKHSMEDGWQLGGQLISNWQWHPKIPNYDIVQIPRDPGNTSAYNLGAGISRSVENITMGVDVVYEPIRSHTWADAAVDIPIQGSVIPRGAKTVDNFFRFNNRIIRAGIQQTGETVDVQLGVHIHTIRYVLDQTNYEQQFRRGLNESWSEWTLNAGVTLKLSGVEIRYAARLALGTGQPGINQGGCSFGGCFLRDAVTADSGFIVAPAGNLFLQEAKVFTSQFTIQIPVDPR